MRDVYAIILHEPDEEAWNIVRATCEGWPAVSGGVRRIRPSDAGWTVGNGNNGGISSLERRLNRIEARIAERLSQVEVRIGELEKTTNTVKGTVDTWKWVVPVAVLFAGVLGTLLGLVIP